MGGANLAPPTAVHDPLGGVARERSGSGSDRPTTHMLIKVLYLYMGITPSFSSYVVLIQSSKLAIVLQLILLAFTKCPHKGLRSGLSRLITLWSLIRNTSLKHFSEVGEFMGNLRQEQKARLTIRWQFAPHR